MGMFDYVFVEQPGFDPKQEWQTKDFDHPGLDRYTITSFGRLHRVQWLSDGERSKVTEDVCFSGVLHFYDYLPDRTWIDCSATFVNGTLVNIERQETPCNERR